MEDAICPCLIDPFSSACCNFDDMQYLCVCADMALDIEGTPHS